MSNFLAGKRALILGVASNRSIAYGIAKCMHEHGAELAFTYQGDKLKPRVEKFAGQLNSSLCFPCDVSDDANIEQMFTELDKHWDKFDILVHAIAYAPGDMLEGDFLTNMNKNGFLQAQDISVYSFASLAKHAQPRLNPKGSLLTLSYLGAERVVPNYNVMGVAKAGLEASVRYLASDLGPSDIRVNAISAGPIKTLAASGIRDFKKNLKLNEQVTPLRKTVSIEEVGHSASFLCSDLASGITGEILYVDAGYHIVGLPALSE